ncbi:MAG: ATP-dependent Clp protease ATP-binding subunit [Oscillospiraceae bacterium]|nr:ATP-dependent Clp protease ATP-binding subunit [Oscillospiraceae bacterium]
MVLCSKCKKRPAVVFISALRGEESKNEGYCLVCARDLNIPQVSDYLKSHYINEDDLEEFSDRMMEMMQEDIPDMLDEELNNMNPNSNEENNEPANGTIDAMPNFLRSLFGGMSGMQPGGKSASSSNGDFRETRRPERNPKRNRPEEKEKEYKFLNNYCTNLSKRAENNELDRIIGRDREISRAMQILSRRTKNNPCLIGEPGVGKTAIAEGLAQRIAAKEAPFHLLDKKIYLLDLTALVAGTQFRGQFESRVKGLIADVVKAGNVILFIDEVHNLVGAGDSEGSMNAANILKPALSRGEIQVIGATTFKEYRKYIEKDSALERRFQPVTITEPTVEETADVLIGIREYYENYHRVHIEDRMLKLCAVLSERYITNRFLPDKAIDLLDESCAYRSIRAKELTKLDEITAELDETNRKLAELSESDYPNFEKIAETKSACSRLEMKKQELEEKAKQIFVEESDLAAVIELWTGIPANKIAETEMARMKGLADRLRAKVIGQDEAVDALAKAIKRSRIQFSERIRPASFIFVGPTGVGKTELVKVLASELFDAADPLIRLDMTEFMEKHSVARLIGSPPGYVGYDEAGQLTEKVRRKPYSVILFDEIEKAHPDVMNILMQILDEGQIEDAQGRTVSFAHTVICMTSNAGSTDKSTGVGFNKTVEDISKEKALKALRDFLRPEFISRIDEIIVFRPLTEQDYASIAGLMLDEMKAPLEEKGITLTYKRAALECIAAEAFGKRYGAREIRRVLRDHVEDAIAAEMIDNGTVIKNVLVTEQDHAVKINFN